MEQDTGKKEHLAGHELDAEIEAAVEELRQKADPDLVEEAEEEVRRQLRREIRARLSRTVEAREAERKAASKPKEEEDEKFVRFSLVVRLQHICLMTSCVALIITGLPMKFPDTAVARIFFSLMGGVGASGAVHRIGAALLISVALFHVGYILFFREGRKEFRELLPKPRDVGDVIRNVRYFLGMARHGARFGRFSYVEKFDYWAVYWGTVVMITSGLMLWGQDIAMAILPKFCLDMAREAHSDEALLATLAIIVWHFYNVHWNPDNFPMNRTWLTGKISKKNMMHHHPIEYEKLMAECEAAGHNGRRKKQSGQQEVDKA
ncbi:MAG: cytochrome b/b6 domain-containing protein [Armatimonadetes bacterium]|nr:cytochrome b/b6 domain-containing protein [Armatimonadota bacterium]